MKKCPFCGADIEDTARFCLYCMQPLVEKEQILPHKKKMPQWLLIIAAIVVIFLTFAFFRFLKQGTQKTDPPSNDPELQSTTASTQTEPSNTQPVTEPLHIHSYSVKNTTAEYQKEPATCTTPAIYYYACQCGEKGSETFSHGALAEHIVVTTPGHQADCVNTGLTDGQHCSVCNIVFLAQTPTPVIGHTFDSDQDERCNLCNYIRVLNCNHRETNKLPAVTPTCTSNGLTEGKTCALCEEILIRQSILAPLGHTAVIDQAVAPTCTANGKTEGKHCSVCQLILVSQQDLPASGHAFSTEDPAAPCSRCGAPSSHIHSYSAVVISDEYLKTESTCMSAAVYYYSCACGKKGSSTFSWGEKGSHTIVVDPAVKPTCDTSGLSDGSHCSVCQKVIKERFEILATGHTFRLGSYPSNCLVCGAAETLIFQVPEFPFSYNNTYRIDGATYVAHKLDDGNWRIAISFTYTNISSSAITGRGPTLNMSNSMGYTPPDSITLQPNQSAVFLHAFFVHFMTFSTQNTYELVFT